MSRNGETCEVCNGSGEINCGACRNIFGQPTGRTKDGKVCWNCHGARKITCAACGGRGHG